MALLEQLRRHVTSHFQDEERYLDAADPTGTEHLDEHRRLLLSLDVLIADFEDGHGDIVTIAQTTLSHWLWDHIFGLDIRDFRAE